MIELQGVNKYFYRGESREIHALKDIDLTFHQGEFTLLSGASGCGKTTLLNAIGTLDDIDRGKIIIDGVDTTTLSANEKVIFRREHIGFVFQAYNLVPVLTVAENIGFIMKLQGFENEIIERRVREVASKLEIENRLNALPNNLSGGQQQRVAVARAIASKPKIVLADEPTANLDSKNSQRLMDMMKALNQEEGISIIFASHDDYIMQNVNRVVELHDGKIVDKESR
ncbi:MAG: ABC transporter ATP-binding protein [Campylobacterota bacterium]|nr:ABC transporter ATP-binding protein [Campylobacterota bacterium]